MKKTNKTRKIAAMIAAMALTATLAVPMSASLIASADDYTVTIEQGSGGTAANTNAAIYTGDTAEHTYEAYQIFAGTLDPTTKILSNITWGSGINQSASGFANIYSNLGTAHRDFIKSVTLTTDGTSAFNTWKTEEGNDSKTEIDYYWEVIKNNSDTTIAGYGTPVYYSDAAGLADALGKQANASDNDAAKAFADEVAKYLSGTKVTGNSTTVTISDTAPGYYLIQDAANSPAGNGEVAEDSDSKQVNAAKTRYILAVVDSVNVRAKSSYPTVEKKVKESAIDPDTGISYSKGSQTFTNYNDVADYNIGDTVDFLLIGTMPSNLTDYTEYYYQFNDTLGQEFDTPTDVVIKIDGTEVKSSVVNTLTNSAVGDENVYVKTEGTGAKTLTIRFDDILKDAVDEDGNVIPVTSSSIVTVEYKAVLNSNAAIGRPGQINKVDLTYSNNPNWKGDGQSGTTEKTPEDRVIVFTYELDTTKVNAANTSETLANAEFYLYREVSGKKQYAVLTGSNNDLKLSYWVQEDTAATYGADGTIVLGGTPTTVNAPSGTTATTPTKITTTANGLFMIKGLDEGTYYLKESKAPATYNLPSDPFELVISANTLDEALNDGETVDRQSWAWGDETSQGEAALLNLSITANGTNTSSSDTNKGKVEATITNTKGSSLPSTGGMGTTLFVVGGGVTMAAAGIYLVSKKRSKDAE